MFCDKQNRSISEQIIGGGGRVVERPGIKQVPVVQEEEASAPEEPAEETTEAPGWCVG